MRKPLSIIIAISFIMDSVLPECLDYDLEQFQVLCFSQLTLLLGYLERRNVMHTDALT